MILKNGMELIISRTKKEDAREIVEFLNIIGGESDNLTFGKNEFHMSVEDEEKYLEEVENSKTTAFFIGRIDGKIVCSCSLISPKRERLAHQATLGISVKKEYWNMGIATELMKVMIDFAKSNGQTEIIHLGVRADNHSAIHLYKKMGFEEIGRYKNFFKVNGEYFDDVLMNLYL